MIRADHLIVFVRTYRLHRAESPNPKSNTAARTSRKNKWTSLWLLSTISPVSRKLCTQKAWQPYHRAQRTSPSTLLKLPPPTPGLPLERSCTLNRSECVPFGVKTKILYHTTIKSRYIASTYKRNKVNLQSATFGCLPALLPVLSSYKSGYRLPL